MLFLIFLSQFKNLLLNIHFNIIWGKTMNCIFCKIVEGLIPAKIIYQDKYLIAFDDINPRAPIHKLIIPRKHLATLNDMEENDLELAGQLFFRAKKLAEELGIAEDGYRVLLNCNANGGQEVYHLHLHLLGGRKMHWPPG